MQGSRKRGKFADGPSFSGLDLNISLSQPAHNSNLGRFGFEHLDFHEEEFNFFVSCCVHLLVPPFCLIFLHFFGPVCNKIEIHYNTCTYIYFIFRLRSDASMCPVLAVFWRTFKKYAGLNSGFKFVLLILIR